MNKAILIGRLTRDPENTTTASGIALCRFSLAINRPFTTASGEREADFINCVAWRSLAENCGKYLFKGSLVGVEGSIQTRSYEDNSGNKRYATEVIISEAEFLSSKKDEETEQKPSGKTEPQEKKKKVEMKAVSDEDLLF